MDQNDRNRADNVTQLHRPLGPQDRRIVEEATQDVYHAVRTAYLLMNDGRERIGLPPLPPIG